MSIGKRPRSRMTETHAGISVIEDHKEGSSHKNVRLTQPPSASRRRANGRRAKTMPPQHTRNLESTLHELETTFDGSNGNDGTMFDVSCPPGDHRVEIVGLDVHVNIVDPACPILVYGRNGMHQGFENVTEAWTLLVNTTVTCKGFGARTEIPAQAFLETPTLEGGDVYAFYTTLLTPNLRYSNGNQIGAIQASSQFLQIHEGTGVAGLFGGGLNSFVRPRVWNGVVRYQVTQNSSAPLLHGCENDLETSYADNLGSYGNMFDVQTFGDAVSIIGIDFYSDVLEPVTYEIYTRNGSYATAMAANYFTNTSTILAEAGGLGELPERDDVNASNSTNSTTTTPDEKEMWTLVQRGTTNGLGVGRGTPVRGFAPVLIPPDTVQGFYVTLTTPDLRYRNVEGDFANVRAGDVFSENDDIAIEVGVSVGSYPLGDTFFAPRLWSGAIHYVADHGCPTTTPSQKPSIIPSLTPSMYPSVVPSFSPPDFGNCTDVSSLKTTFVGGKAAFGNMFTVTAGNDPVSVVNMDIHVGNQTTVRVFVYTKDGGYKGFEQMPSAWRLVSNTTLMGAGGGEHTTIPKEHFETVHVRAQDTRAFYVTLSSADLRYSQTSSAVGKAVASSDLLSIHAGAGLADPDFGATVFYEPRQFNGVLHFRHSDDCIATVTSTVVYSFNIQHAPSLLRSTMLALVSENVGQTVSDLLQTDVELRGYVEGSEFALSETSSLQSDIGSCEASNTDVVCTPVDTVVRFSHQETLATGNVVFALLELRGVVEANLDSADQLLVQYSGNISANTGLLISLNGEFTDTLNDVQLTYFQETAKSFLNRQLALQGINVLGVEITSQTVSTPESGARRLQRTDPRGGASSSLTMSTTITGEYRPPPYVDFEGVAEDAIDAEGGEAFRDDLSRGTRERPAELDIFTKVSSVSATPASTVAPTPAPKGSSMPIGPAVGGAVGGFVLLAFLWWLWLRRRNSHKTVIDLGEDLNASRRGWLRRRKVSVINLDDVIDADCEVMAVNSNDNARPAEQSAPLADPPAFQDVNLEGLNQRLSQRDMSHRTGMERRQGSTTNQYQQVPLSPGSDRSIIRPVEDRSPSVSSRGLMHAAEESQRSLGRSRQSSRSPTMSLGSFVQNELHDSRTSVSRSSRHTSRSPTASLGSMVMRPAQMDPPEARGSLLSRQSSRSMSTNPHEHGELQRSNQSFSARSRSRSRSGSRSPSLGGGYAGSQRSVPAWSPRQSVTSRGSRDDVMRSSFAARRGGYSSSISPQSRRSTSSKASDYPSFPGLHRSEDELSDDQHFRPIALDLHGSLSSSQFESRSVEQLQHQTAEFQEYHGPKATNW